MKNSMLLTFMKIFVLLIVIPIICINIVLNQTYKSVLLSYYSGKMMQTMEQMSSSIEEEIKRVSLLTSTIAYDEEMLTNVTKWHKAEDTGKKFQLSKIIDGRLRALFNYNGDITSAVFFLRNHGYYHYNNNLKIKEDEARELLWYKQLFRERGKVVKLGTTKTISRSSNHTKHLAIAISPKIYNDDIEVDAVYLEVRTTMFNTIYSNMNSDRYGEILLMDAEGEVVASSNNAWRQTDSQQLEHVKGLFHDHHNTTFSQIPGSNDYISTYFTSKSNWMIANIIDYDVLTGEMKDIMIMFSVIYIIVLSLFILFAALFFRDMIVPIKKLIKQMKRVEKGNLDELVEVKGPLEIRTLNTSYNKMVTEINQLINTIDLKEKERSREEIKALQAQINPHFIYNTLNCIRLMAMMSKADGIRNMTDSFMKLISATFQEEGTLITLEDEMAYIESYIYVMQVRYGDHFFIETDITKDVSSCEIVRMLLQPIVENAILHGVSEAHEGGAIKIRGYSHEDAIIVEVKDYGAGMTEEEISDALQDEGVHRSSFNHIGIKNVERRIKLNFGEEYGLEIESEKGEYTTVRLRLPKIYNRGDSNDQYIAGRG